MNKYNLLHSYIEDDRTEVYLDLDEVKSYLRLEGFIDDSDSPSSDFDDDDDLITDLIKSATKRAEKYTGLSLMPVNYSIEFTNLAGYFKIPFGPVTTINTLYDADDEDQVDITDRTFTIGNTHLKTPVQEDLVLVYSAGYADGELPEPIKEALLKEIAYRYMHRGDELEDAGFCKQALSLLNPYKEVDTWLG